MSDLFIGRHNQRRLLATWKAADWAQMTRADRWAWQRLRRVWNRRGIPVRGGSGAVRGGGGGAGEIASRRASRRAGGARGEQGSIAMEACLWGRPVWSGIPVRGGGGAMRGWGGSAGEIDAARAELPRCASGRAGGHEHSGRRCARGASAGVGRLGRGLRGGWGVGVATRRGEAGAVYTNALIVSR
jgi:hypothetical protein